MALVRDARRLHHVLILRDADWTCHGNYIKPFLVGQGLRPPVGTGFQHGLAAVHLRDGSRFSSGLRERRECEHACAQFGQTKINELEDEYREAVGRTDGVDLNKIRQL
jgi:hypothetical protein